MAGRPGRSGRRRQDHSSPLVDLDLVFADDRLIDRISQSAWGPAERTPSTGGAHRREAGRLAHTELATADPLAGLFQTWRDELAADPMPALPPLRPTLVPQLAERPVKRRSLRPALSIAAAIAALLVGTATIGSKNASPESALWHITQVMWPDRVQSVASRDTARTAIEEAEKAIQAGRSRDAQLALLKATVALGTVDSVDGLDDMQQKVQHLWIAASPAPKTTGQPDRSSAAPSAGSSTDLPTPFGLTATSEAAPAPLVTAPSSDPAAQLAGGVVGAPVLVPAPAAPPAQAVLPALVPAITDPSINPAGSVPSTDASAPPSSVPESVSEVPPPASSELPPSDATTSLPPPEPVQSTVADTPPASAAQSAPEQSPPAPTPLTQAPEPDPTPDPGTAAVADSVTSAGITATT